MDPELYVAMAKQWRSNERAKNARAAAIVCILANINRRSGSSSFTLEDFIGEDDDV